MELNILLVPKFHTHRQWTLELTPDSKLNYFTLFYFSSIETCKKIK